MEIPASDWVRHQITDRVLKRQGMGMEWSYDTNILAQVGFVALFAPVAELQPELPMPTIVSDLMTHGISQEFYGYVAGINQRFSEFHWNSPDPSHRVVLYGKPYRSVFATYDPVTFNKYSAEPLIQEPHAHDIPTLTVLFVPDAPNLGLHPQSVVSAELRVRNDYLLITRVQTHEPGRTYAVSFTHPARPIQYKETRQFTVETEDEWTIGSVEWSFNRDHEMPLSASARIDRSLHAQRDRPEKEFACSTLLQATYEGTGDRSQPSQYVLHASSEALPPMLPDDVHARRLRGERKFHIDTPRGRHIHMTRTWRNTRFAFMTPDDNERSKNIPKPPWLHDDLWDGVVHFNPHGVTANPYPLQLLVADMMQKLGGSSLPQYQDFMSAHTHDAWRIIPHTGSV